MGSSSQYNSQLNISVEEKDKLVGEVIRCILYKTHNNSGCPIKREELTQIITKNYNQRLLPNLVINEATAKVKTIFGFQLKELQRSRPSSNKHQSVTDAKSYILISELPDDLYRQYVEDVNTAQLTGFTFGIICVVHLTGGKVPEENLWHHLRRMGLHETDESHAEMGSIKQALEILVQQRYLQKDKVNGPEASTFVYELAERALDGPVYERIKEHSAEVAKMDVAPLEID